ncbi:MAG: Dephospho-CoA kinase [Syntrophorhabdus sp. PtaB.Bin047]|nr:MAG: Dephospho-CoA kinase [Syntrophorhabdus sp. PtaB.Bin047]
MITIGITGIIGSGKSTASAALGARGIPVIDLDALAKKMLTLAEVHEEIEREFGNGLVIDGQIVVEKLRDIVFADKEKLRRLERITHPRMLSELWQEVAELAGAGEKAVIVDGPLLFETGLYKELDRTVVVTADMDVVRKRLKMRGMAPDDIEKRISNQIPLKEKEEAADYVLSNNGTREDLERNIEALLERINEWEVRTRCTSTT